MTMVAVIISIILVSVGVSLLVAIGVGKFIKRGGK